METIIMPENENNSADIMIDVKALYGMDENREIHQIDLNEYAKKNELDEIKENIEIIKKDLLITNGGTW